MGAADWGELALVSRVDQWVSAHPFFFIVSVARLIRPTRAAATVTGMQAIRPRDSIFPRDPNGDLARVPTGAFRLIDVAKPKSGAPAEQRGGRPLVLPLRKVQSTFPSMMTVGRTDNNDLVVPDEQVSKFHAFFRLVGDRVELSDAGSRNGTFVAGRRLEARGASAPVPARGQMAFGAVEFQLFDARGCWEWLRQLDRF
ncbi:MAG: serine/threonine protein kinase with domain [bacterium]|nr:serine/threonine protein kinase with domain [bacterium]